MIARENVLERKNYKDSLTGLLTLEHFLKMGKMMLDKGHPVTVLVIDLNYFKQINDTFGYSVGNSVLIQVANYLKQLTKNYNKIIARLGGDEFILAIQNYPQEGQKFSELLCSSLNDASFYIDSNFTLKLSFSVGEADSKLQPNITIEGLLNRADKNMYFNKFSNYNTISPEYTNTFQIPEKFISSLKVLAEKDMYTYVHSIFTARNSAALSKKLGLPKSTIKDIYIAGLLHDIGKLLLPNDILKKPAKLTYEEYEQVKLHVNYSVNILADSGISEITLNAIKSHHCRWDGTGYPYNTKGEDIPLEGRIMQIADAYTAMTIKRLYRNSLSSNEAVQELQENSGKQFDPFLTNSFVELLTP